GKEYTVLFAEYGNYTVKYAAKDCFGKTRNQSFFIKVVDHVPPVIEFTGSYVKSGTAGQEITVAGVSVTELESDPSKVEYYVFVAHNGIYRLVEDGKFTPTEAGEYKVICYAVDANGNYSENTYVVNVK
ncbi:MAG: hypothetical protein J5697_02600, partial [Clostridia bacterium]|nr:hypothetical protein [Clostridia bacterium]